MNFFFGGRVGVNEERGELRGDLLLSCIEKVKNINAFKYKFLNLNTMNADFAFWNRC